MLVQDRHVAHVVKHWQSDTAHQDLVHAPPGSVQSLQLFLRLYGVRVPSVFAASSRGGILDLSTYRYYDGNHRLRWSEHVGVVIIFEYL